DGARNALRMLQVQVVGTNVLLFDRHRDGLAPDPGRPVRGGLDPGLVVVVVRRDVPVALEAFAGRDVVERVGAVGRGHGVLHPRDWPDAVAEPDGHPGHSRAVGLGQYAAGHRGTGAILLALTRGRNQFHAERHTLSVEWSA